MEEDVPAAAEVQIQRVVQAPTALKPIPVASGSNKSGVADMAGRVTVATWVATLVLWCTQNINRQVGESDWTHQ